MRCDEGDAALLQVTPNVTWPDVVYYHSYTTPYMGWKIHVIDSFRFALLTRIIDNTCRTAHNIVPIADGIGRPDYSVRPDFQTGRDSTAPKMAGRAGQWSTMQKAS